MKDQLKKYQRLESKMKLMGGFFREFFRGSMSRESVDKGFDFSMMELKGIAAFMDMEKTYTIGELSKNANLQSSNMTFIINQLEQKGIAVKERSQKDKRVVNVKLTEQGRKLFRGFVKKRCEEFEKTLGQLSNEDQKQLFDAIEKATHIMQKLKS